MGRSSRWGRTEGAAAPPSRRRGRFAGAGVLVLLLLAGCVDGSRDPAVNPTRPESRDPLVYVAIGASETTGVGTRDPRTDAWPKVLWREALATAEFHGLGEPGSTLREALVEQARRASALDPDVVTVWLNVNDLIAQVPVASYEQDLHRLLRPLTDGGATVLVATTPRIDSLPIYLACRPDPPAGSLPCLLPGIELPDPTEVRSRVARYNAAIERVAARTGATVVDLQAFGNPAKHPGWIAGDGFHPSTEGAEVIAGAFARALPQDLVAQMRAGADV